MKNDILNKEDFKLIKQVLTEHSHQLLDLMVHANQFLSTEEQERTYKEWTKINEVIDKMY